MAARAPKNKRGGGTTTSLNLFAKKSIKIKTYSAGMCAYLYNAPLFTKEDTELHGVLHHRLHGLAQIIRFKNTD